MVQCKEGDTEINARIAHEVRWPMAVRFLRANEITESFLIPIEEEALKAPELMILVQRSSSSRRKGQSPYCLESHQNRSCNRDIPGLFGVERMF